MGKSPSLLTILITGGCSSWGVLPRVWTSGRSRAVSTWPSATSFAPCSDKARQRSPASAVHGRRSRRERSARRVQPAAPRSGRVCRARAAHCLRHLANLLLARASARAAQSACGSRWAPGRPASRDRCSPRPVLALLGGLAGVLVGFWLRDAIPHLLSTSWNPAPVRADFSGRVMLLSFRVTLLTVVLFSLAPMWHALERPSFLRSRRDPLDDRSIAAARRGARSLSYKSDFRSCSSLPAGCSCGLSGTRVPPISGSTRGRSCSSRSTHHERATSVPLARSLFTRLEAEIAGLPGVQAASLSSDPLVAGSRSTTHVIPTVGVERQPRSRVVNDVGTMFFETMGIPIVHGEDLGHRIVPDRCESR